MTTVVHIMLDLETWGTEPGCDIRSIGACVFDPLTGAVNTVDGEEHPSHFYIATMNGLVDWQNSTHGKPLVEYGYDAGNKLCRKYPLTRDPKTIQWWNEQSDEAHAAFANPVDLKDALGLFAGWISNMSNAPGFPAPDIRLWSHGGAAQSSFDIAILYAAYKAVGLPVPWHYRAPRDTRTAFDMAGVDDHSAWLRQFDTGTFHHALHDAISQAKAVCAAYERVRLPHELHERHVAWQNAFDRLPRNG